MKTPPPPHPPTTRVECAGAVWNLSRSAGSRAVHCHRVPGRTSAAGRDFEAEMAVRGRARGGLERLGYVRRYVHG